MNIFMWYGFYWKLFQLKLVYATSPFDADNNILVLNSNSGMHIQDPYMCTELKAE